MGRPSSWWALYFHILHRQKHWPRGDSKRRVPPGISPKLVFRAMIIDFFPHFSESSASLGLLHSVVLRRSYLRLPFGWQRSPKRSPNTLNLGTLFVRFHMAP